MRIAAPAKINLSLRITGVRPDRFHALDSVMIPLELRDWLDVELTDRGVQVRCDDAAMPRDEENLAGKAARAFLEATGTNGGVTVSIEKAIPSEAGLGGGSSDAAATLVALNRLVKQGLPAAELLRLAESIGSDVPFFLDAVARRCLGKGEQLLEPLAIGEHPVLVVKPPFGVSTPWAYRAYAAMGRPSAMPSATLDGIEVVNDLERPVLEKFVSLALLKEDLLRSGETLAAGMTGSGSALFAILREGAEPEALAEAIREEYGETFRTIATRLLRVGRPEESGPHPGLRAREA